MNNERLRLQAMGDQAWASAMEFLPDIERISRQGLNGSERDQKIVRMIFSLIAGDLYVRRAAIQEGEGNGLDG
jgi:hypothetical protein